MGNKISRRRFIGQASCAGLGYTTLFSTLFNLKAINAGAMFNGPGDDYKAMVCLLLNGGADSFNMLMPKGVSEWNQYKITRSNLAIPRAEILPLNPITSIGMELGVHPSMKHMQNMFNNRELSFITNVGTLINGVDKDSIFNGLADLPLGLYSHADQMMHWQTGIPQDRVNQGWGGRIADLLTAANTNANQNISMNVSLAGSNTWQTGNNTVEYSIDPVWGSTMIDGYNQGDWQMSNMRTQAIDNMLDQYHQDMFKKAYIDVIKVAKAGSEQFTEAVDKVNLNTFFSDNRLSQSFQMVAKTISARTELGMKRQIFFIEIGGWDHHDEVLLAQEEMLTYVDNALFEFMNALEEINSKDCVTVFSMSEFGRTLTSNGNGTDHAWGGNVFALGGPVKGGQIIGQYPSLALESELDLGGGVLIPKIASDEYFAELALWFGVAPSDLTTILPNITNFYSPGDVQGPLGFLL